MFNSFNRQRVLGFLIVTGLVLCGYYLLVYRPLSRTVAALDAPLTNVWNQLTSTNPITGALEGIDFIGSSNSLRQVQAARRTVVQLRQELFTRISLDPAIQSKLSQPFQLIDFQNERQLRMDQLLDLAKTHAVTLDPAIATAYPRYAAEQDQPTLLWAELEILHQALATAVQSKVSVVRHARIHPVQFHNAEDQSDALVECRIGLGLIAPMPAIARFLLALPLLTNEIQQLGLTESLPAKPPLFIHQWMLRKDPSGRPDDVQLDIVLSGFCIRTRPAPVNAQANETNS